ncbi:MAG: tetratricopeptide repeat protein [Leptolyngbyaceae cyanobacterium]
MTQTVEELFEAGLERYQNGDDILELIPMFKEVCERSPKSSPAWTCLSWLYLLVDKPTSAYRAAQKAVKLNPEDPQARINLAIAMIDTSHKGVRTHVELAQQFIMAVPELKEEVEKNFADGLSRKPGWKTLTRVQGWILD